MMTDRLEAIGNPHWFRWYVQVSNRSCTSCGSHEPGTRFEFQLKSNMALPEGQPREGVLCEECYRPGNKLFPSEWSIVADHGVCSCCRRSVAAPYRHRELYDMGAHAGVCQWCMEQLARIPNEHPKRGYWNSTRVKKCYQCGDSDELGYRLTGDELRGASHQVEICLKCANTNLSKGHNAPPAQASPQQQEEPARTAPEKYCEDCEEYIAAGLWSLHEESHCRDYQEEEVSMTQDHSLIEVEMPSGHSVFTQCPDCNTPLFNEHSNGWRPGSSIKFRSRFGKVSYQCPNCKKKMSSKLMSARQQKRAMKREAKAYLKGAESVAAAVRAPDRTGTFKRIRKKVRNFTLIASLGAFLQHRFGDEIPDLIGQGASTAASWLGWLLG